MAAVRHLGFVMRVLGHPRRAIGGLYHCAKFGCNRCSTFFHFSKWRPPPSWIFEIFKFLTFGMVKSVKLHHRAKFRRNRSNRAEIWLFFYFQDGGRRYLGFVKF